MLYSHKLPPLKQATFIKRYKRFLVDVHLNNQIHTVHCPNSGSMKGLLTTDMPVWVSTSSNPNRKLAHTLEIVKPAETLVGINTHRANTIVHEALKAGILSHIYPHQTIHKERRVDTKNRIDFMLEKTDGRVYLEVKNVTLINEQTALFPDAVTQRGTKHIHCLHNLMDHNQCGLIFLIQRGDATAFNTASTIDPAYAEALNIAIKAGLHIHILKSRVTPTHIHITAHQFTAAHTLPPWNILPTT